MKSIILMVALLCFGLTKASDQNSFNDGLQIGEGNKMPLPTNTNDIPNCGNESVQETQYNSLFVEKRSDKKSEKKKRETAILEAEISKKMNEPGQVGDLFNKVYKARPIHPIKPDDPLFQAADRIVDNPQEELNVRVITEESPTQLIVTEHTCEESRLFEQTCSQKRLIHIKNRLPKKEKTNVNFVGTGGAYTVNVLTGVCSGTTLLSGSKFLSSNTYKSIKSIVVKRYVPFYESNEIEETLYPWLVNAIGADGIYRNVPTQIDPSLKDFRGNFPYRFIPFTLPIRLDLEVTYLPPIGKDDLIEEIIDDCDELEEQTAAGLCEKEEISIEGAQTKQFGGVTITNDWWNRQFKYQCEYPSKNNCLALLQDKNKNCYVVSSVCKAMINGHCVVVEQKINCEERQGSLNKTSTAGNVPFCLDGDCSKSNWAPNQDMAEAISKLAIFKEMQTDVDAAKVSVFRGDPYQCKKTCLGFKDCCRRLKGWGTNLHLAQCDKEEIKLAEEREKKKCVFVGTYCSKKVLGKCAERKSSYCCFATKLARIVQEQGRSQLYMGWGTGKEPICRALTVEELSRIDFSKLDLSELLAELMANMKLPSDNKMTQELQENLKSRVPKDNDRDPDTNYNLRKENEDGIF